MYEVRISKMVFSKFGCYKSDLSFLLFIVLLSGLINNIFMINLIIYSFSCQLFKFRKFVFSITSFVSANRNNSLCIPDFIDNIIGITLRLPVGKALFCDRIWRVYDRSDMLGYSFLETLRNTMNWNQFSIVLVVEL